MQGGESEDDEAKLPWRRLTVQGSEAKLFLVQLPERGRRRETMWVFNKALEQHLWGDGNSNLYHCLEELRLEASQRLLKPDTFEQEGLSAAQFALLMDIFWQQRREFDPLANKKARQAALLPKQVSCTIALHRCARKLEATAVLRALGAPVPQYLQNREEREAHEAAGELNLSLPDAKEEADPEADELFEEALAAEVVAYEPDLKAMVEEQTLGRQYALQDPSATLEEQLEALRTFRLQVLVAHRAANAVTEITCKSDVASLLRFLGYCQSEHAGLPLDMSIFRAEEEIQELLQSFCNWLHTTRAVSFGTIAGYCNSLLNVAQFAIAEVHGDVNESCDDLVVNSLFNLRSQAQIHPASFHSVFLTLDWIGDRPRASSGTMPTIARGIPTGSRGRLPQTIMASPNPSPTP